MPLMQTHKMAAVLFTQSCHKATPERPLFYARGPKANAFNNWTPDFFNKMKKPHVFDSESMRKVIHYLDEPGLEL